MSKAIVIDRDGDCLAVALSGVEEALGIVQHHHMHERAVCVVTDAGAVLASLASPEKVQAAVAARKKQTEARAR